MVFAFALTAPAYADPSPSPAPKAPAPSFADQIATAIKQHDAQFDKDEQFFRHFAYTVYAPVCADHKGLDTTDAVKWPKLGEAYPADVKCADGSTYHVTGPKW